MYNKTNFLPRLAITSGEPAGIGPDIVLQALSQDFPAELVVFADPDMLQSRAKRLGMDVSIELVDLDSHTQLMPHQGNQLKVYPLSLREEVLPGKLSVKNSAYVLEMLSLAGKVSLAEKFSGIVTAPVHKAVINQAGIPFSGHTEFFAELASVDRVVMMLATAKMRVVLVTTHVPLRAVPQLITTERLEEVILKTEKGLRELFGIDKPRIAVAGLNPHAGEGGYLGSEEQEIIEPLIRKLQAEGYLLFGPLSADTMFVPHDNPVDVFVAMYHDQGLPVLKFHGFGQAVNITLGLPFIRTSVDHGTALELAGTGKADSGSMHFAVECAINMAQVKAKQK